MSLVAQESPQLPLGCYRLQFTATQPIKLPKFTGSMWRGVFGTTLRQKACLTKRDKCDSCPQKAFCGYVYLFETEPPRTAGKMHNNKSVPRPFVFGVSLDEGKYLSPGKQFALHIILFGRANEYLPLVVDTFVQAGTVGIGLDKRQFVLNKRQFVLTGVEQWLIGTRDWKIISGSGGLCPLPPVSPQIPACPSTQVTIRFETPVHIQVENEGDATSPYLTGRDHPKKRTVGPEDLRFHDFFMPLLRRFSMISYFHTENPFETDFLALKNASLHTSVLARNLVWKNMKFYSERQGKPIILNGILGSFTIPGGDLLAPFWPVLWLGQWLHVGKDTVRGLGRYSIVPA